jgi:hypothetical protein
MIVSARALAANIACPAPTRSSFWERLDELCAARELVEQATFGDPSLAAARDELGSYCASASPPAQRPSPAFAAASDEQRMQMLVELRQAAGAPEWTIAATYAVECSPSRLLEVVARRIAPDNRLYTGAGTAWIVGESVRQACDQNPVREWLPLS